MNEGLIIQAGGNLNTSRGGTIVLYGGSSSWEINNEGNVIPIWNEVNGMCGLKPPQSKEICRYCSTPKNVDKNRQCVFCGSPFFDPVISPKEVLHDHSLPGENPPLAVFGA